ncbi:unnamed protein product [Dovyalis caffra]|uniref:Uncharacterized protein n=1 Tax=Dovyalis caffra TaxID=77055 RepID=A0AAV1RDY2_9ROSI|nr:unnamed protein product [Dovyalis caffra]
MGSEIRFDEEEVNSIDLEEEREPPLRLVPNFSIIQAAGASAVRSDRHTDSRQGKARTRENIK